MTAQAATASTVGDFDGDRKTDASVFRPASGWWFARSGLSAGWGDREDVLVPADYNGDARTDVAVFRPATGTWFVKDQFAVAYGTAGDWPVQADYNGDGRADVAVFRPSSGTWLVRDQFSANYGASGDWPVPADYNGDGRADVAVFRPATGTWFVRDQFTASFGAPGDIPVPADYNGDGRTDLAVYRPATGTWFVRNGSPDFVSWGTTGDVPVPGDYDGNGSTDFAVFRPSSSTFFVRGNDAATGVYGTYGDLPVLARTAVALPPPPSHVDNQLPVTTLVAQHSGKCLDVAGAVGWDGAQLQQFRCHGAANQDFTFHPAGQAGDGTPLFTIVAKHSGKCLDVNAGGTDNGTLVLQHACHGGAHQKFALTRRGGNEPPGVFQLFAWQAQKCVDVLGATPADETKVAIWTCGTNAGNQWFKLRAFGPAGEMPFFRFKNFKLTDRAELRVNVVTGNLEYRETDLSLAPVGGLPVAIVRNWNSLGAAQPGARPSSFGTGWTMNWGSDVNQTLLPSPTGKHAVLRLPSGIQAVFWDTGSDTLASPPGQTTMQVTKSRGYTLRDAATRTTMSFAGPSGSVSKIEDVYGNAVSATYQPNGQLAYLSNPRLGRVAVTYSSSNAAVGRVATVADWTGRTTIYGYSSGALVSAGNGDRPASKYGYDANGRLSSVTDPRGNMTTIGYDAQGRATTISQPGGIVTTLGYNAGLGATDGTPPVRCNGANAPPVNPTVINSTTVTDAERSPFRPDPASGISGVYCYDTDHRVVRAVGSVGAPVDTTYDAMAHKRTVGTGAGTKEFVFDGLGRGKSATTPTGTRHTADYADPLNPWHATTLTDAENNSTFRKFNRNGELIESVDPEGGKTRYGYNPDGTLASVEDERGKVTSYGYDSLGRLTSITPPAPLGKSTYEYDTLHRVKKTIDGRGVTATISTTPSDEVSEVQYSNGTDVTLDYDNNGNLTSRGPASGDATANAYRYDALNRLEYERLPSGRTITYGFDKISQLRSVTEDGQTTRYDYIEGTLSTITEPGGAITTYRNGYTSPTDVPVTSHKPWEVRYPNGIVVRYQYDSADRPEAMWVYRQEAPGQPSSPDMFSQTIVYTTRDGRDTSKVQELVTHGFDGKITWLTYAYDKAGRLTGVTEKDANGIVTDFKGYGYDAAGNRTRNGEEQISTYNDANQQLTDFNNDFVYDANGNRTKRIARNTPTSGTDTTYTATYNAKNQTTSMTPLTSIGYSGPAQTHVTALGPDVVDTSALGVIRHGNTSFIRAPAGAPVAMKTGTGTHYYIRDFRNSVVGTLDVAGNVSSAYSYDAWGKLKSGTGAVRSPLLYNSELAAITAQNMYKIGHRFYDANAGRWTQPDPSGQEANAYAFAGNDPVNNADPDGLFFGGMREWCKRIIGGVIVGGISGGYLATGAADLTGIEAPASYLGGPILGGPVVWLFRHRINQYCDDHFGGYDLFSSGKPFPSPRPGQGGGTAVEEPRSHVKVLGGHGGVNRPQPPASNPGAPDDEGSGGGSSLGVESTGIIKAVCV